MSDKDPILDILLKEYDKLKTEQAQRIGFRDNLLYPAAPPANRSREPRFY